MTLLYGAGPCNLFEMYYKLKTNLWREMCRSYAVSSSLQTSRHSTPRSGLGETEALPAHRLSRRRDARSPKECILDLIKKEDIKVLLKQ